MNIFRKYFFALLALMCLTLALPAQTLSEQVAGAKQQGTGLRPVALVAAQKKLPAHAALRAQVKAANLLRLDEAALKNLAVARWEAIEMQWPLNDRETVTVELVRQNIILPGAQVLTPKGEYHCDLGLHYQGVVKGSKQSFAALSVYANEVVGVFSSVEQGNLVLGKLETPIEGEIQHVFYRESDCVRRSDFSCGLSNIPQEALKHLPNQAAARTTTSADKIAAVRWEAGHSLFTTRQNSVPYTVQYIMSLANICAAFYSPEQINLRVSEVFVWDTPDPYPNTTDADTYLNAIIAQPRQFRGSINHVVIAQPAPSGGNAQIAYLCNGQLCSFSNMLNGVFSEPTALPTYSWAVNAAAHELGHGLGSPHTHDCVWDGAQIDDCGSVYGTVPAFCYNPSSPIIPAGGGTLMGYCHLGPAGTNLSLGLGPKPGEKIRSYVAGCGDFETIPRYLETSDNLHTVPFNGTFQDFKIPPQSELPPKVYAVQLIAKGGDGGSVQSAEGCNARGGEGGKVDAVYRLGGGADELGYESTLRFIVGGQGSKVVTPLNTLALGGGGGGGTGVLLNPNGTPYFYVLAAAGGGGGGYVARTASSCTYTSHGVGGQIGAAGANGTVGSTPGQAGTGGTNGAGGASGGLTGILAGGGGGFLDTGGNINIAGCRGGGGSGGTQGGQGSLGCGVSYMGGFGYGGGGSGQAGGAGGGGGGGENGAGGGGGSFARDGSLTLTHTAGSSTLDPNDGYAQYKFLRDETAPTARCVGSFTAVLGANGSVTIDPTLLNNGSSDLESGLDPMAFAAAPAVLYCADYPQRTVTLEAGDRVGNKGTCTVIVTIVDNTKPTMTCPSNHTLETNNGCSAAIGDLTGLATDLTDNCGSNGLEVTQFPAASTILTGHNAALNLTLTLDDKKGNQQSCQIALLLQDKQPPSIVCPANTTVGTTFGCSGFLGAWSGTVADNCASPANITQSQSPAANTVLTGANAAQMVTLQADDGHGNTQTCQFQITLKDVTPPSIFCPANIIRSTDPNRCDAVVSYATPTATDHCSGAGLDHLGGGLSGSVFQKGTTVVTWMATDAANLTSTCAFSITVNDSQAPGIVCPANLARSTDPNQCSAVVSYTAPTTADNCSPVPTLIWVSGGTAPTVNGNTQTSTFPKGTTVVQWRATDGAGLTKTCTFRVIVSDNQAPSITCPPNLNTNTATGTCASASLSYNTPTATDNCAPAPVVTRIGGPISGANFPVGTTTVIWRAVDGANKSATCTFTVTVTDAQPPTVTCPADLTQNGCNTPVFYTTPTAADNCGINALFMESGMVSGSVFPVGTTTVVWKATDNNGLQGTCSFVVTVYCPAMRDMVNPQTAQQGHPNPSAAPAGVLTSSIAPNPFVDAFNISMDLPANAQLSVRVFGTDGRLVTEKTTSSQQGPWTTSLEVPGPTGIYLCRVRVVYEDAAPAQEQVFRLVKVGY